MGYSTLHVVTMIVHGQPAPFTFLQPRKPSALDDCIPSRRLSRDLRHQRQHLWGRWRSSSTTNCIKKEVRCFEVWHLTLLPGSCGHQGRHSCRHAGYFHVHIRRGWRPGRPYLVSLPSPTAAETAALTASKLCPAPATVPEAALGS